MISSHFDLKSIAFNLILLLEETLKPAREERQTTFCSYSANEQTHYPFIVTYFISMKYNNKTIFS